MKKQLELSESELIRMGFTKNVYPADEYNSEKTTYEIPILNGKIYYNLNESIYRWYIEIKAGDYFNSIHLNIETTTALNTLLQCFRINSQMTATPEEFNNGTPETETYKGVTLNLKDKEYHNMVTFYIPLRYSFNTVKQAKEFIDNKLLTNKSRR
ncbi:MAG: hypothetical protein M1419_00455 [Bacteroidetes bacterium]|nr:hypothetical protein [Bacteroidota bacterium]